MRHESWTLLLLLLGAERRGRSFVSDDERAGGCGTGEADPAEGGGGGAVFESAALDEVVFSSCDFAVAADDVVAFGGRSERHGGYVCINEQKGERKRGGRVKRRMGGRGLISARGFGDETRME